MKSFRFLASNSKFSLQGLESARIRCFSLALLCAELREENRLKKLSIYAKCRPTQLTFQSSCQLVPKAAAILKDPIDGCRHPLRVKGQALESGGAGRRQM